MGRVKYADKDTPIFLGYRDIFYGVWLLLEKR